MTLKRIEALREDELGQVTTPFYALSALKNAQLGYSRIQGFDAAWEGCTDSHGPWDWNHRARGFERLRTQIEQGVWVLVLDPSWPPISPAYRQVNGQWEVTRGVWETTVRHRLESRTQILQRQQREQKAFQSQNRPSSATEPHTESASGPGNRPATLGPQAGGKTGDSNTSTPPKQAASNAEKGHYGEARAKAYIKDEHPSLQKTGRDKGVFENGIDGVYKNKTPPPDYVLVEAKYNKASLGYTRDGKQMSDGWLTGEKTGFNRIRHAVGKPEADAIKDAMKGGQVEKWLVRVDEQGNTSKRLLDSSGKLVRELRPTT